MITSVPEVPTSEVPTLGVPASDVSAADALKGPGSLDFRVYRRRVGPILVLSPTGELDACTAYTLTTVAAGSLWRTRSLVMDLSALTFMDCHGLGQLITVNRLAARVGVRAQTAALPAHAHRLFTIFDLYPTLGGRNDVAAERHLALRHLALQHLPTPAAGPA